MRLEWRKTAKPLRTGRRRLARDRRGGEAALGIRFGARVDVVLEGPEEAAVAKVPLDAPDHALENIAQLSNDKGAPVAGCANDRCVACNAGRLSARKASFARSLLAARSYFMS